MNYSDKPAGVELDGLDLLLARELELDARQSYVVLAKKLNTSETTVKRRLQRLLDEGVVTVATITTVTPMEFLSGAIMGLTVRSGTLYEVADHLRSYRGTGIVMTTGRYDVIIGATFRSYGELIDFLDKDLRHVPHLIAAEPILILEVVKLSWKYLNDDTDRFHHPPRREIDELDRKLIKELELSPRESLKNLGSKLGTNRRIIGKKLQSLLADNVIQIVSIAKPSLFGLNVQVCIFVQVQQGKIRSVANHLVADSRVHHVCIVTGPFQLFVKGAFRDLEEMTDYLTNHLGKYEGVITHETLVQVGIAKRSFSILV